MAEISEENVRDLVSPFADTGSTLAIVPLRGDTARVSGQRKFQQFAFEVTQDDQGRLLVSKKRGLVPLREHLASGAFADLDRLARSMVQFLGDRLGDPGKVVEGTLRVGSQPDVAEGTGASLRASEGVEKALYSSAVGTAITFLHGDAGAGKSWLLMKVALEHAREFLQRKRPQFPLYVDAQGVNLRSIAQQIAHQLDGPYNGILRYAEVTPMVRLGALGLIIDGFDELIMPSGYSDTLRALMSYVDEFRGEGAIVASARTSFLHAYATKKYEPNYPYFPEYLQLLPWTSTDRREYSCQHGRPELAEHLEKLVQAAEVNAALLGRPFLVAHVFDLLAVGEQVRPKQLLATVEDAIVERERTQKLRDPDRGGAPLLTREQFDRLLEEIAEEMWLLRQNSLDRQTARMLASLVAESAGLERSERELLEQRIDSHSFLESEGGDRVRFPHEIVFSRILAKRILGWVQKRAAEELAAFLRVAPLKVSMVDQIEALVAPLGSATVKSKGIIEALVKVASSAPRSDRESNIRLNVGSIVARLLTVRRDSSALLLKGLHFAGVSFQGANMAGLTFKECWFQDVDARGAEWQGVIFVECLPIVRLEIEKGQVMPEELPQVSVLVVFERSVPTTFYGSRPTREALFGRRPAERPVAHLATGPAAARRVLESLCKKVLSAHHWFVLEGDSEPWLRSLRRDPHWETVVRVLERHGFLRLERRQKRGPSSELAHIQRADEILAAIGGDAAKNDVATMLTDLAKESEA